MIASWARRSLAAATSFMARVIFCVLRTEVMRLRMTLSDGIGASSPGWGPSAGPVTDDCLSAVVYLAPASRLLVGYFSSGSLIEKVLAKSVSASRSDFSTPSSSLPVERMVSMMSFLRECM